VYLGVRPRGFAPQFHVNGRETFLAAIRWEDDWPVFDEGHYRVPRADTTFVDAFDGPLRPQWLSRAGEALGEIRHTLAEVPADTGSAVTLAIRAVRPAPEPDRITSPPDRVAFGLIEGGEFRSLAELDGRYFSTEVAGGFTGRVIGIGAAPGGATIARFSYAPIDDDNPSSDPATAYGF